MGVYRELKWVDKSKVASGNLGPVGVENRPHDIL